MFNNHQVRVNSGSQVIQGFDPVEQVWYLDTVTPQVEETDASDVGQDGVSGVVQHVVCGHRRQALSLLFKEFNRY